MGDTLPAEVWADMLEDESQETELLRAWLLSWSVDNYANFVSYWSMGNSPHTGDNQIRYGDSISYYSNGMMLYTDLRFRESGNGGGYIAY